MTSSSKSTITSLQRCDNTSLFSANGALFPERKEPTRPLVSHSFIFDMPPISLASTLPLTNLFFLFLWLKLIVLPYSFLLYLILSNDGGFFLDYNGNSSPAGSTGDHQHADLTRALVDSISRSLEVLFEMPYTTDFPPGLPADLVQLLRELHAPTERLMDEVTQTNRLLQYIDLPCSHLTLYRLNLGSPMTPYYLLYLIHMVRLHLHPGLRHLPNFDSGHKLPSSFATPSC